MQNSKFKMQNSKCKLKLRPFCILHLAFCILHSAFCILHYLILYDTDIPSPDGETIVVKSDECPWTVRRNGSMSFFLFTTLCAVKTPPGVRRGNTMSKNFL